jgi:hypothetical protein
MLAFEGDAHVEWFEDYEADKIRRLGPDAVERSSPRSAG